MHLKERSLAMFGVSNLFLFAVPLALGLMYGWIFFWVTLLLGLLVLVWRKVAFSVASHQKRIDVTGKAVLITGCDSGFGHSLALRLFHLGFTVFATCLFPDGEGAQRLRQEAGGSCRMHVFKLDVTQDQDVADAKDFLLKKLPEKGRLVFMSSISAYLGFMTATYSLSKIALEKCGDMLRQELKKFGVKVSLIEPGNYFPATNILKPLSVEEYWSTFDEETKASYSKEYLQFFVKT